VTFRVDFAASCSEKQGASPKRFALTLPTLNLASVPSPSTRFAPLSNTPPEKKGSPAIRMTTFTSENKSNKSHPNEVPFSGFFNHSPSNLSIFTKNDAAQSPSSSSTLFTAQLLQPFIRMKCVPGLRDCYDIPINRRRSTFQKKSQHWRHEN